jgi:CysZ protein
MALRGVQFAPMGLFRGFLAPFRGALYIARERLWRHLIVPIVLNLALGVATLLVAGHYLRPELAQRMGDTPVFQWIALIALSLIGGALAFILLQPLLSAVFCDRLSEIVEKRRRGTVPTMPLLKSIAHALLHGLLKLALYGIAIVIGMVLFAATGIGSLIGVGLGAIFLAYDGFDYPLARRNATFAGKWAYLAKNPGLAVGYGLGAYVLYLIPFAFLVAPPFAAVGATVAFLEVEDRAAARKTRKPAPPGGSGPGKPAPEAHNPIDISAS